jgi:hypothetical protein
MIQVDAPWLVSGASLEDGYREPWLAIELVGQCVGSVVNG